MSHDLSYFWSKYKHVLTCAGNGTCLYHDGGGVYRVLAEENTPRTKRVRKIENRFPGLNLFTSGPHEKSAFEENPEVGIGSTRGRVSSSKKTRRLDTEYEDLRETEENQDGLTFVPSKLSTYGTTSSYPEVHTEDPDNGLELMSETHGQYSVSPREQINMAMVYKVEKLGEPELSSALRSTERDRWLQAINA